MFPKRLPSFLNVKSLYMFKTLQSAIIIIAILLFSVPPTIAVTPSAKGEWIEHPFDYPSLGTFYAFCGEDCLGVTRTQSTCILFFDINGSAWTELIFDTQQTVHNLEAEGHTVFALTDDFLIGYSAYTSDYDVTEYVGTLLEYGPYPSYGCGKNLAFFVTDEMMYVFDAKIGHWQEYDYVLPANYANYSECVVRDDYIWLVIHRGTHGEVQPKNVVYSLHTHSFNHLENGCWVPYAVLDHGFARWHEYGVENYSLIGYSAFTNEFDVVQVSDQGYLCFSNVVATGLKADEITAYAVSFRQVITPYVLVRADFYGYDTRIGSWSHTTVDFHYDDDERYSGSWQHGGQFVIDMSIKTGEIYNFILYSGITGQFSIATPGITYNSVTSGTPRGGEVLVAYDIDTAWGHSFSTQESSMIPLDRPNTAGFPVCGEDFCIFSRYSEDPDIMTTYIYNSETNSWTTFAFPKQISMSGYSSNEHVFVWNSYSPTRETVFYSSFLDAYVKCDFPVDSYVWQRIGYALAWASSNEKSYVYDAQANALYEFDFEFVQNGLGDFAASFFNADTRTLYGYSALSTQWTNLTIVDTPYVCVTKGFIGLVASNAGMQYYSKYYAFNGLEDSWVELVPEGTYEGDMVGQKTALVIRSNMLYAFDPNGATHTYNYSIEFEGSTYPVSIVSNSTISDFSFNQSLKEISFNVTAQNGTLGFCNLTLPNTLMQNLWQNTFTVLVDGKDPIEMSKRTDGTYTYVYFTYVHSEHEVVIIPEFRFFLVLPLLMIVTLAVAIVCRRRITMRYK
jgi:hypothetical protein